MFGGSSFKLFDLMGFRIGAHWSLAIALALAGFTHGGLGGIVLSVLLFASILAHELGHAVVARRRGVPIAGIDLHMFGGVAKMAAPPKSPNDEIAIAIAGPAVSLLLGAAFLVGHALLPALPPPFSSSIVLWLGSANLMLGVFNMLPALPLDGGRVFRAVVAKKRGLYRGTKIAVTVSRVLAVALGIAAALSGQVMLVLLAVMVWMMGSAELKNVEQHEILARNGWANPWNAPWSRYDRAAKTSDAAPAAPAEPSRRVLEPDVVIVTRVQ